MPKKAHLYIGRAGQLAVMAEFLARGYNVAVPEVDIGDDILVVKDSNGEYLRVQVKTAIATKTVVGYSARYMIKLAQLQNATTPETWYIFANRLETQWHSFVVISRESLSNLYDSHGIGSVNQQNMLSLYLSFSASHATCSGQDFSQYVNNWDGWPFIQHES